MSTRCTPSLLALSLALGIAKAASASETGDTPEKILDQVVVKADPLNQALEDTVQPAEVLSGAVLDARKSNTLGETVNSIPGVSSSYFGPGVGRPVIRGQDGARVAILANGMASDDASAVSQDHAVSIEPFLADQIEVIKGPTTLLYGSGAIAGIVNASDGRIATSALEPDVSGRMESRYDQGSSGFTQMLRSDWGGNGFAFHVDGVYRDNGNIAGPDGDIANSAIKTRTAAVGGTTFTDWGYAGAALSRYLNEYGNPSEPGDGTTPGATLSLQQNRFDSKLGIQNPGAAINTLTLTLAHTDYRHTEFSGGAAGTQFFSEGNQFRAEAIHGNNADHQGVFGLQIQRKQFEAIGEEAFIPSSRSGGQGLFLIEKFKQGDFNSELGARLDINDSQALGFGKRNFNLFSASAATRYSFQNGLDMTLNLDHAERAPAEEELYSDGLHTATATYEIGDPTLAKEAANQIEIGAHLHGKRFGAKLSVYRSAFDQFIYLSDTGLFFDDNGTQRPIRQWAQSDAYFTGYEAELSVDLGSDTTNSNLRFFTDGVRAKKADGSNLPRIPSHRFGAEWNWDTAKWRGGLNLIRTARQTAIADYETPTDGYTLLNANINYLLHESDRSSWEAFLQGNNLGNQTAYSATSAIKDLVPLPGRNVFAGIRAEF